jgi:hypothetical protein
MNSLRFIPMMVAALHTACTSMTGTRPDGSTYAYRSVGGDAKDVKITPDGATAAEINTSKSLGVVTKTIGTVAGTSIVTDGLTEGTRIVQGETTRRLMSADKSKVSIDAGREATKQAKIAADAAAAGAVAVPAASP